MKIPFLILFFFPLISFGQSHSPNQLLILLNNIEKPDEVLMDLGAQSFESLELLEPGDKDFFKGPLLVKFGDDFTIESKLEALLKNPQIKAAQYDLTYKVQLRDPLFSNQWEHQNPSIKKVWRETTKCEKKLIAVLDTGINFSHSDLSENISPFKFNAINPGEDPIDHHGHGTLVASIIAAKGENGEGVAGICWQAKLISIKVLNDLGEGFSSSIIKGINFAKKHKTSILNLSFGTTEGPDLFLKSALKKSLDLGALAVVPAGNNGADLTKKPFWPCSFKLKGMVCVGSTTANGELADFSNFGDKIVDLAAPGESIFGIAPGSLKSMEEDFKVGWIFGVDKGCVTLGSSEICHAGVKKDFGKTTSNHDFSYLQFSASNSRGILKVNNTSIYEIYPDQTEYFFDLSVCQKKDECLLEFFGENGPHIKNMKIWGLKLGKSSYQKKFGSSLSTAYVSGLAALIGSYNPNFTSKEIIKSLKEGSRYSKNLEGKVEGSKIIEPLDNFKFLSKPKWN